LLRFAARQNSLFSLVWRDRQEFIESAVAIEKGLRPDLVKESRVDRWPGSQLFGHLAMVRMYRLSSSALSVLAEAGGFYAWGAPDRPEDLAFYIGENNPWLGSIAHER